MLISWADLLVFTSASLMLNLTPGNDMMFVLGQSLRGGFRTGLAASLGIGTGLIVHLVLVALGVAVILAQHPAVFSAIRYLGAAYLVWVALKTVRSGPLLVAPDGTARSAFAAWRDGTLVNVFNPKIIVFIFAFLPPFIRPENGWPLLQLMIFGAIFNIGGTLINIAVAAFASNAARLLSADVKIARGFTLVSAALFLVLAGRMVFDSR